MSTCGSLPHRTLASDRVVSVPEFLQKRRADVRRTQPWSPFAYVNLRLSALIAGLIARADLTPGSRVLDYGCADAPYRSLVPDGVEYVGADLAGNPWSDVTLDADGRVPVPDGSFDLVLSSQVLEHVTDPALYLAESFRVLRPGGAVALSTHGIMYYHADPQDHWRWTHTGLAAITERAGFEVVEVRGVLGLTATAIQLFQDGTYTYVPRFLRPVYALIMQGLISLADRFYSEDERLKNALVLGIRAVKPTIP